MPKIDLYKLKAIPDPLKEDKAEGGLSKYLNHDIQLFAKRLNDKRKERF